MELELPERARQVFLRLCCMEDADRFTYFVPHSDGELALLAERGLIEIEGQRVYLRPDLAATGRATADPEFVRSVDEEFAANWVASLALAPDGEQEDPLEHAAPYLRRLGRWDQLAELEDRVGHHSLAIEAKAEALRHTYETGDPAAISRGHHDIAVLLSRVNNASPRVLANCLASAIIAFRVGADTLGDEIDMLAMFTFAHGLPGRIALDDICAMAEQTDGLRALLARLPQDVPDELQQLIDRVLARARGTMADWTPLMTAIVLQASGNAEPGLAEQLDAWLADLAQSPGSTPMVRALRGLLAGERGHDLLDGLGLLPSGIVLKVLGALSEPGRAES